MALVKPPLASVEPGRPITAQGWNQIVDALSVLYDAVLAIGSGSVTVSVQSDGRPVPARRSWPSRSRGRASRSTGCRSSARATPTS